MRERGEGEREGRGRAVGIDPDKGGRRSGAAQQPWTPRRLCATWRHGRPMSTASAWRMALALTRAACARYMRWISLAASERVGG